MITLMIQHPDEMTPSGDSHRLAAIVFADIVGSTATMERDEKLALKNLARMRKVAYPQVEAHAGKVIKELGDGFLAVFNSAIKATTCSLDIQKELKEENDPKLRISIHIGDVVVEKGDVFGSGVNIASRLNSHAPVGGIAVSGDVWRQLQNKGEYAVRSLGFKEMKGVGEPFEVFELLESAQAPGRRALSLQGLKLGHIPHYLGPYLVGGWTFMHFTNWFAGQYLLSPYLPKFIFTLLVSLIPTAILLGYLQKQRGPKAKRYRMIGVPANLVLSGFLLLGLFRDKDLGSMMINVSAMSEEGQTIQRTVPKAEFRKKIMVFYFENETGDTTLNWLYDGIMEALYYDLCQDLFIDVTDTHEKNDVTGHFTTEKFERAGYKMFSKLPLSLKIETAKDNHKDFLLCGTFKKPDTNFVLNTEIYATENGKLLGHKEYKGSNLFHLIDEITIQTKTDLKEPPQWLDKAKDLPVKDITTDSLSAWRMLTYSMYFGGESRVPYLNKAVGIDPGFALAYKCLFMYDIFEGPQGEAPRAFNKAMEHIYRLPDKEQVDLKVKYYNYQEHDVDKIIALLQPWCELHPEDIDMRKQLAENYLFKENNERAYKEYKNILKTAPEEYDIYLNLGEITRKDKEADSYYEEYVKHYPNDLEAYLIIGENYYWRGDSAKARRYTEKATIIKPDNSQARDLLARNLFYNGEFQKGQDRLNEAFQFCRNKEDSFRFYLTQMDFYGFRGQMKKGMETNLLFYQFIDNRYASYRKFSYGFMNYYTPEGRKSQYQLLDSLQKDLRPYEKILAPFEFAKYYLATSDISNAEKEVTKAESLLQISIVGIWQKEYWPENIRRFKLTINGLKGNLSEKEAIEYYDTIMWPIGDIRTKRGGKELGRRPWKPNPLLGKLYNRLGNLKKAENQLKGYLKRVPFRPDAHYELALVYADMGKKDKAIEHLNKALYVWAEADTDYVPAKRAREKLAELQATK